MKTKIKLFSKFLLLLSLIILTSCEKDLYEEAVIKDSKIASKEISVNQLLKEINNPIIKNFIKMI